MSDEKKKAPKGKAITSIDEVPGAYRGMGNRKDVEDLKRALGDPEQDRKDLERALNPPASDPNDYPVFVFRKPWYKRFWKKAHGFLLGSGKIAGAIKAIILLALLIGSLLGIKQCSTSETPKAGTSSEVSKQK